MQNFDGDTALHWACRRNSLEIAELLIEKGKCSLHLTNSYSENPCNIAQDAGHSEVLRYLQSRGGEVGEGRKKRVFQMQYASPMEAARDGAERQLEAMFHMSHGQGKQDICNTTDEV